MIALKRNQGILKAEAENFFTQARDVGHKEADCVVASSCEKGHGRIEEREIGVTNQLDWLFCKEKWKDLTSLIEVTTLKRLASTMIRIDLGGIQGTAQRRRQAAWDDSWTLRLLSRIFEVKL